MKRLRYFVPVLAMLLFGSCASVQPPSQPIVRNTFLLDTVVSFTIYDSSDETIADALIDQCAALETIFDRTDPRSEVYALNHAGGKPVTVSTHLLAVLQRALFYAEATDGRFDITICPVTDLWDFTAETPVLPSEDALQQALAHVDWHNIVIHGDQVQLNNGAMIDLGGIAKGYIADQLAGTLRQNGVRSAWINLGGNVVTVGQRPDGTPFRIGVQKPFEQRSTIIGSIAVQDQSSVTAGVYERSFLLDGVLYHHILDTATGYPANTGLHGVTVVADSSMDADALSTCIFLFGIDDGLAFAQKMGVHAVLMDAEGNLHFTPGFEDSLQYQS